MDNSLVHPREITLGRVTLVLGIIGWLLLIVGTFGVALIYLLLAFVGWLFAQSALIAYLRNTAVLISPQQFPDLHARLQSCCNKLGVSQPPEAYVLAGNGLLNAFATRFLGRDFVVLLSDMVDALEPMPDGVDFYIGHELGHVCRRHLTGQVWRWPALWLPLLGPAYSRAKESTCDLHGGACCESPETAARALMLLAAGEKRWATANPIAYADQLRQAAGFWSSFHELISGYPWLAKRVARAFGGPDVHGPTRSPFAYLLAAFVPFAGRLGSGAGFVILVAIIGMLAAVALPAYQGYVQKAEAAVAWQASAPLRQGLQAWYEDKGEPPESLAAAGLPVQVGGRVVNFDPATMILSVPLKQGALDIVPRLDDGKHVIWHCEAGEGMNPAALPPICR